MSSNAYFLFFCAFFALTSALRLPRTEKPSSKDSWDSSTLAYGTTVPWPESPPSTDSWDSTSINLARTNLDVSANHPGSWIHHHIWKCGGTNMCDMATRNGEILNRNPRHGKYAGYVCDVQFFPENAKHTSFAMWQAPMGGKQLDHFLQNNFSVSLMMRNPLDQVLSHYHHVADHNGAYKFMTLSEWIDFGVCRQREGKQLHPKCLNQWFTSMRKRHVKEDDVEYVHKHMNETNWGIFSLFEDNMQTRWISGAMQGTNWKNFGVLEGGPSSKGDVVGEKELEIAHANLAKYTDVFILENFDSRDKERLVTKLGWTGDIASHKLGTKRGSDAEKELHPDEIEYAKRFVQQDLQLYDFAKKLASAYSQRA